MKLSNQTLPQALTKIKISEKRRYSEHAKLRKVIFEIFHFHSNNAKNFNALNINRNSKGITNVHHATSNIKHLAYLHKSKGK